MTEISDRFRRRAAAFTERVDAVPPDGWDRQSPCDDWVARDIVRHMVDNAHRFLGFVDVELPSGPSIDDDPAGAWVNARDAVQAGLDDPAVATRVFDGMMGKQTFERAVDRFGGPDLVVHAWDLARATGLDERLDPDDVHEILEAMEPMDEMMRGSGAFGPKVEPPPGADDQTRLLAFLGRTT
jgi:uncharacterized protein (TIGR03086 family)